MGVLAGATTGDYQMYHIMRYHTDSDPKVLDWHETKSAARQALVKQAKIIKASKVGVDLYQVTGKGYRIALYIKEQ